MCVYFKATHNRKELNFGFPKTASNWQVTVKPLAYCASQTAFIH